MCVKNFPPYALSAAHRSTHKEALNSDCMESKHLGIYFCGAMRMYESNCYDNIIHVHVLIEYGYDHVHRFYTALASSDSRNDSGKLYN